MQNVTVTTETLDQKIKLLKQLFDTNEILAFQPNSLDVQKYYRVNKIPYTFFHTKSDLMYMGISRDGVYKESDLLEHVKVVESYVRELDATTVLELATGRGANSFYLASRFPTAQFYGVDISDGQLELAKQKAKKIKNYFPQKGDYHDLSRFASDSFDMVFEVEALCYSENKQKVLNEVKRVLKPRGVFILFDGYRVGNLDQLPERIQESYKLMVLGMAVNDFESHEALEKYINNSGMSIIKTEDLSQFILPTLRRFERLSQRALNHLTLAKLAKFFLPKLFMNNLLSGYLMPDLVQGGICSYIMTVCRK